MESPEWQAAMRERDATKFELEEAASEKAGLEDDFARLSASEVALTTKLEELKAQVAAAKAERAGAKATRAEEKAARETESSVADSEIPSESDAGKPSDVREATDAAAEAEDADVSEFSM
jgi:hypothetical protein